MDENNLLTLTFLVRKKAGMTFEDFVAYLNNYHGVLSADLLSKYGIVEYTQVSESAPLLNTTDLSLDLPQ